ncbi:succinylglutamate desuccinylase [Aliidiomarina sedimenti]|uniref:Succinylglutamate desuccinylase n=1 Tax=Aliidiomarina sedimenti TaxID=1933879 RepID=A0ABY0BXC3_9GAMM|nr:succinylglutamate desuccinylase [Aliidiomarina sedimenti]RUO28811.1 succinylglutamate desuccinylase [Aliidiomarina sedimenti]
MLNNENFLQFTRANEWGIESTADLLTATTLDNGVGVEVWDSGVIVFTPANSTPATTGPLDLVLSCAVHGDETAPIEICDELIEAIREQSLTPAVRVMFIIANPAAINIGKRFVDENMNRLFSGAHSEGEGLSNNERVRAKAIEGYVQRFFEQAPAGERQRLHYDMHTAIRDSQHEKFAVYPFTHGKPYKKAQLQLLAAMGVDTVLLHEGPTTTFSYFSVRQFDADAFTVELGKVRPFGENPVESFAACRSTLRQLIAGQDLAMGEFDPARHHIYQVLRSINRTQQDFELNFADDVANFTEFEPGYILARDGGKAYPVLEKGEAIIFPNAKVALGQRALITVKEVDPGQLNLV